MLATILGILKGLLDALPALDNIIKFFKKTPQENVDKSVEDLREEIDKFKETGRPGK
jgi:hypothetical protein